METVSDHALAARVAATAGRVLCELRTGAPVDSRQLGAAGDVTSNALITALLRQVRPDDGLLTEEAAPEPSRLNKRRVWIIDPLDGTREFGERAESRSDWAVHVALSVDGVPAACAVALPALELLFATAAPAPLLPPPAGRLKILVSRTRAPALARHVAQRLDAELVPMGSAGAKSMAVLRGEAHAYLHAGGLFEWDSCAPVGVALAAGLHASRIDGSACRYNQPDTRMPDLLVCRTERARELLDAIASAGS